MLKDKSLPTLVGVLFFALTYSVAAAADTICADDYDSIQEALDKNKGRMVYLAAKDYEITRAIRIESDSSGLFGSGTIVQTEPAQEIIRVQNASHVKLKDITLTRPEGKTQTQESGICIRECTFALLDGVSVIGNCGPGGSISMFECENSTVRDCLVENYKGLTIDDRTANPEMGYAFQAIDGTGMKVLYCNGTQVRGNRIVENVFVPSEENRDKYGLGTVTVVPEKIGRLCPHDIIDTKYTNNWHQGSAIIVGGTGRASYNMITENYIENAAQGIDNHSDYVIISNNIINGAMIGMKAMHGSRNVIITSNHFSRMDLWGLLLMPGAASKYAEAAKEGNPPVEENVDGGTVVSDNVFSDFGQGGQAWNWEKHKLGGDLRNVIAVLAGQLPENPPIRDVIISQNIVYDTGQNKRIIDGKPTVIPPGYGYALYVEQIRQPAPQDIKIMDNILHPGQKGVCNIDLIR